MTATTGPEHQTDGPDAAPPAGPERWPDAPPHAQPGWHLAPTEPSAFDRFRTRRPWVAPAVVGGILALATGYTALNDPTRGGGLFPGCPLKELTGLDCPGCGGTRAVHALTNGDIGTALDHNAVLSVVVPLLAVAWGLWMVHAVRRTLARRRDAGPPRWPAALRLPEMSHRAWVGVIVFLFAFAVVRNISAVPAFDFLASEA